VPICFPWFGPKADDKAAPQHGFARTMGWQLEDVREQRDAAEVVLTLASNDTTTKQWAHRFFARYAVRFGGKLELELTVENRDEVPLSFEAALHAYFSVRDVADVRVRGLEGRRYVDKVSAGAQRVEGGDPIAIRGETDRVYLDATGGCELVDPNAARKISIQTDGTRNLVVWNPGEEKARGMKDVGEEQWRRMLCIEPANVLESKLTLKPGETHTMRARIVIN